VLANLQVPVVLDVPVWWRADGYFDAGWERWNGGHVRMPTPLNIRLWLDEFDKSQDAESPAIPHGVAGWHVIPICGYSDSAQRFFFKNSWGDWGFDKGFGTIPYAYIGQFSRTGMIGAV